MPLSLEYMSEDVCLCDRIVYIYPFVYSFYTYIYLQF